MVQILGRTPRLAKRRARKRGQEWGLIFACSSIVSGGKKWQHRVQFFSPQSNLGPAREASLTDDFQHLCYAAVADEGLHIKISLSLSVCLWDTPSLLPLPTLLRQQLEWQTFRENYLEMGYNNHFVKTWNFPPFKHPIKSYDYQMVSNSIQRIKGKGYSSTSLEFKFSFQKSN